MEAKAVGKFIRVSTRKARIPAQIIKGMSAVEAVYVLKYMPKGAAHPVKKVLESAIANAEHNDGADIDALRITSIYIEKGTVLTRFTARAKGRGNRILKPTCHIFVTVGN